MFSSAHHSHSANDWHDTKRQEGHAEHDVTWHDASVGNCLEKETLWSSKGCAFEKQSYFFSLFVLGEKPNKEARWGPKVKGEKKSVLTQMLSAES